MLSSAKQLSCYCPPEDDNSPVVEESMPDDVPDTSSKRRKWFLDQERLNAWVWRKGRVYRWDFCSGLMDFNDFSVGLPGVGFRIHVMKYWDGQPLRWELKNRRTGEVYGVVQLEPEEEGSGSEEGEEKNEELD